MNFYKEMVKYGDKEIKLYVDMDGVIADYDFGNPLDFKNKRPLLTNIKVLEKVSKLKNVDIHILSVCKKDVQIKEKNDWLDKYAPFIKKENREVLSKESNEGASKELKANYLKSIKTDALVMLIDDDNEILKFVRDNVNNVILYQDSVLVD